MEKSMTELKQPLLASSESETSRSPTASPSACCQLAPGTPISSKPPSSCNQVYCAGCRAVLSYQEGPYCIQCPFCRTLTAVVPLSQLQCAFCRQQLMYPAHALYVACTCGRVFSTAPVYPSRNITS